MLFKQNFDDLDHLLKCTNKEFDIFSVSETRITKKALLLLILSWKIMPLILPLLNLQLGTCPFVSHLSFKPRTDLNIYKANQLVSAFSEIINPKKSNIVIGYLYKHPNMDVLEFKNNYLSQISETVSKERKQVFPLGDFNVNLLNYNDH